MPDNVPSGTVTIYHPNNIPQFSPRNESWLLWKEKLDIHFTEINCNEENTKKATLLKAIGPIAYETLHNLCSPDTPVSKTFKELCNLLKMHYTPPTIIFRERKSFHTAIQLEDETVAEWHARVKKLALACKFGVHLDAFVLDRFIMGINNKIFERLCEEDEKITIEDALRKALIMEMKLVSKENNDMQVGNIKFGNHKNKIRYKNNYSDKNKYTNQNNHEYQTKKRQQSTADQSKTLKACSHCGWRNHKSNECRFQHSKCNFCGKIGHLASVCRKKEKVVNYVSESDVDDEDYNENNLYDFSIYSINNSGNSTELYKVLIKIGEIPVEVVCDSGAPCSLVSKSFVDSLNKKVSLKSCTDPYVDFNGNKIKVLGQYDEIIELKGIKKTVKLVVTDSNNNPLFGRNFLRTFNFELVQVNSVSSDQFSIVTEQIKNEFHEIFSSGLGSYKFGKISLAMNSDAKPIFCKPRPVPLAWKGKIENNLRDLIANDVLEQVDHSEWGTPLVPILKPNGDIRICGDYKVTINKYLSDFNYPLPLIDEIFASLQGGQLFSKLDLSNAYNQLILDDKSQLLCTWSTHIGTLKMKRLPFGVKPAAAIFQKTMENLLQGIPFVVVYQDDITVSGKDMNEHIRNLKSVLNKLLDAGLKLNLSKCQFFKEEISYLGFTIDRFGLRKNKERINSVLNAPIPNNISELRAFIGLVNYYAKFVNNFAKIMIPLYKLLQKNVRFEWSKSCQTAYDTIKKEITSDKVLVHFNPKLPIFLTTDASDFAIAGILSHKFSDNEFKPVAFISRSLSKTEQKYSTHEKEALAIIFSVTKLKQYLIGNVFTLRTDHKPLISIFGQNKGLPVMAAARVQRWAFILSGFNYKIEYVKGQLNEADNLSRISQFKTNDVNDTNDSTFINYIQKDNILSLDFTDIARETRRDPILSKVCEFVRMGKTRELKGDEFKAFINKDIELTVDHDCLLWGYRVIIPTKLRKSILQLIHESHFGIVKTKALARSFVWWPNIDSEIENLVKSCISCQKLLASPEKSILIPWTPTSSVWQRIHIDFAGPIRNYHFLIVIDSYSKWVEVFKTKDITSYFVITKLRETFSRFGIPHNIVSDNGTQFVSKEFKDFVSRNKIKQTLTAPGHPATNGQAENFVKTLKKSIYANLNSEKNENIDVILNRFLMDYRNTKHSSTGESPAKMFIGRSIRTRLDLIKPPLFENKILENHMKSISCHKGNRSVTFEKGQNVFIRDYTNVNTESWAPAIIKDRTGSLSYQCILSTGREIKRHTDQIRAGVKDVNNDFMPPELPSSSNGSTLTEEVELSHNKNNSLELNNNVHEPNLRTVNNSIKTNVNEDLSNKNQIEDNENKCERVLRPRTNKKYNA